MVSFLTVSDLPTDTLSTKDTVSASYRPTNNASDTALAADNLPNTTRHTVVSNILKIKRLLKYPIYLKYEKTKRAKLLNNTE